MLPCRNCHQRQAVLKHAGTIDFGLTTILPVRSMNPHPSSVFTAAKPSLKWPAARNFASHATRPFVSIKPILPALVKTASPSKNSSPKFVLRVDDELVFRIDVTRSPSDNHWSKSVGEVARSFELRIDGPLTSCVDEPHFHQKQRVQVPPRIRTA